MPPRYAPSHLLLTLTDRPKLVPVSLGKQHTSKAAAHRSYAKVFYVLSIASFLLYWRVIVTSIFVHTPAKPSQFRDTLTNILGSKTNAKSSRLVAGIRGFVHALMVISTHPAISVTSLDVLFTALTLLTWTFTRDLHVDSILESSVLSFLAPKHEKHVAFTQDLARLVEHSPEPSAPVETLVETPVEATTPRKRGRPSKKVAPVEPVTDTIASSSATAASLRRSTRRTRNSNDVDSDAEPTALGGLKRHTEDDSDVDSTYQPSEETRRAVEETDADGAIVDGDIVDAGESTALALFLAFAGGIGQLASGVLGAEVTGPRE